MFPQSIQNLINQLSKLPDIGPRAAARLVFFLLNQDQKELNLLAGSIKEIKGQIQLCRNCFNIAEKENQLCSVCQDKKRDNSIICLVENVLNIPPIERTKQYNGLYHVLGGLISPSSGIGPNDLKIKELASRIEKKQPLTKEIIFALSPTTEGDTTTFYIERLLKSSGTKISRLARGLSTGSDLEYLDENTLTSAFLGRR